MRRITYLACILAVSALVAIMIGSAMATGNFFVPIIAIPLWVIVVFACRRNLETVTADERLSKVRSQAALRTFELMVIAGAIAAVVLSSFVFSESLSPKIEGNVYTDTNGTVSMVLNLYKPGSPETPGNLIQSTTIRNISAMDETEATAYCEFRQEAFGGNEQNGLIGVTIAGIVGVMLVAYGAFYLYYDKKY
jgi:uncharacterized membrane protein